MYTAEVEIQETKSIILGLHVTNEDKMKLFNLIDQLTMFSYENWCFMRDCNRIVTPPFDRTQTKINQGKLPNSSFHLIDKYLKTKVSYI